ncbi:MAG: GNAT family N-acetyltransferase [Pseudomonadota bacterium]
MPNSEMGNLIFNAANQADIPDLIKLLAILFSIEKDFNPNFTKQKAGLALLIKNNATATVQVARQANGQVIGMVSAQLVISTAQGAASAWIEDMVIDSAFRSQGIGKKLLQHTLAWAKDKGATRAQLLVDVTNTDAIGYYQHLNWTSTQLQARRIFL